MRNLFYEDTIYISDKTSQEEVFEEVYTDLLKKDLVTKDFLINILEREKNYPTGLDLSPVSETISNIAIPRYERKTLAQNISWAVKSVVPRV